MKRLIVMRHGEAIAPGSCADHDRSLTPRGKSQAEQTASKLKTLSWVPEVIIYSDARRTKETFQSVAKALTVEVTQTIQSSNLYLAGPDQIFEEMAAVSDQVNTVLVIGHNPGWTEAVATYSGAYETLETGQACLLEIDDSNWMNALGRRLQWTFVEKLG